MRSAKIAITIDEQLLTRLDRLVKERRFPIAAGPSRKRCVTSSIAWSVVGWPASSPSSILRWNSNSPKKALRKISNKGPNTEGRPRLGGPESRAGT